VGVTRNPWNGVRWTQQRQLWSTLGDKKNLAQCEDNLCVPCNDGTTCPYFEAAGIRTGMSCTSPLYLLGKKKIRQEQ
jgi:hypothetical protein